MSAIEERLKILASRRAVAGDVSKGAPCCVARSPSGVAAVVSGAGQGPVLRRAADGAETAGELRVMTVSAQASTTWGSWQASMTVMPRLAAR